MSDASASTTGPGAIRQSADGVFTMNAPGALSPSLWQDREAPAFELKFQIPEAAARAIADWAREHLQVDPNADPHNGDAYRVHGLYFDTATLDVFHRSPGFRKRKFRLRRYGADRQVFLEQKRKSAGKVSKRRSLIAEAELARLRELPTDLDWVGHWFHARLAARRLVPTCHISYDRQAYCAQNAEGPLRLTLDRRVRSRLAEQWAVEEVANDAAHLSEQVLLELKFRSHLPALFKSLMLDFGLTPHPLSKYRLAMQALGKAGVNGRALDG